MVDSDIRAIPWLPVNQLRIGKGMMAKREIAKKRSRRDEVSR
jgi:hypothetical protein